MHIYGLCMWIKLKLMRLCSMLDSFSFSTMPPSNSSSNSEFGELTEELAFDYKTQVKTDTLNISQVQTRSLES